MKKNEQNNVKIKRSKISIQALINFTRTCMDIFDHFNFSVFLIFSIETLIKCTYFMDGPKQRVRGPTARTHRTPEERDETNQIRQTIDRET